MNDSNRKKLRLDGYDYSKNGAYFITVCTADKEKLLCRIDSTAGPEDAPTVKLTQLGEIVDRATRELPGIDKYVVMPNHVHMIVFQEDARSLSSKIRIWKSVIALQSRQKIWQKSFYDHIIRDERDYQFKWKYIDDNPMKWASDDYYFDTSKAH